MKRTMILCVILAVLGSVTLFGGGAKEPAGGQAKATITIKYSDSDPPGGVRTEFLKNVWIPAVERETKGAVKIQDFWGAALLSAPEALKGISDGVAQMGFVFAEFYPKQLPLHQIFKLFPRGPGKWEVIRWVYDTAYQQIPELRKEIEEQWNLKIMLYTSGLPGAFASTKPITKIEDIRGQKWRASSRWVLEYLRNAGAIPVSVPWADVYMALQTGTIDGVLTNYDGLHMMKFEEPAPNLLVTKEIWWATPFLIVANKTFWNSLPKEVQAGIEKANKFAMDEFGKAFTGAWDRIYEAEKKAGYKVAVITEADLVKWENEPELKKLHAKWIEENKAAGIGNADQIMTRMQAIMKEAMERDKK